MLPKYGYWLNSEDDEYPLMKIGEVPPSIEGALLGAYSKYV